MKIFVAICLTVFAALSAEAQKTNKPRTKNSFAPKIVERGGWTIPAFKKNVSEIKFEEQNVIENVEIQKKRHLLLKEQIVSAESCAFESGSLSNRNFYAVKEFVTLEYQGRIFAYEVNYIGVLTNESSMGYAGCLRKAIYADEDGDGTFELRCNKDQSDFVPRWIKALKEAELPQVTIATGWSIPTFAGDIQITKNEFSDLIEDVDVDIKSYFFSKEKLIYFEDCNLKANEKRVDNKQTGFIVNGFTAYETKGKVIAYRLISDARKSLEGLTNDSTLTSKNSPVGLTVFAEFLYVDEYGDGTFTRRCEASILENLPQWAKDLGRIKVKIKN